MDVRSHWMLDRQSPKETVINKAKKRFEKQLESAESFNVLIDSIPEQVIIQNHTNPMNESKLTKYIHCNINSAIKTGSIIKWDNDNYLTLTQIESNLAYLTAKIQKCNHVLKFYNYDQQLVWYPAIVTNRSGDISEDRFLILPDNKFKIILSANNDTSNISRDKRFIFNNSAWKVVSVNKIIEGLIELIVQEDQINNNDDKENEIADRWKYENDNYNIKIWNGNATNLNIGEVLQLDIQVTNNNIVISDPSLIYTSDNEDVVMVDENGSVLAINDGVANIIISLVDNENVTATIAIIVNDVVVDNYHIEIIGPDSIIIGFEELYKFKLFNNGVEILDQSCVWEILGEYATITESDYNSCNILAGNKSNVNVELVCKVSELSIEQSKIIDITSFW